MGAPRKTWPQATKDDLERLTTDEFLALPQYRDWTANTVANVRQDLKIRITPEAKRRAYDARSQRNSVAPPVKFDEEIPDRMTWEAFDELFTAIRDIKAAEKKYDPRRHRIGVKLPGDKPVGVVFCGDFQLGSEGVDYDLWRADMQRIQDFRAEHGPESLYAIGMGDYQSALGNLNIRGSQHRDIVKAGDQYILLQQFFKLTAGTWLVLLTGCHDTFTTNKGAIDPVERYCELSGARHGWHGVELDIKLGSQTYVTRLRHRYRFNSSLNPLNSQRRQAEMEGPADIIAHAHLHTSLTGEGMAVGQDVTMLRSGSWQIHDDFARQMVGNVKADSRMPLVILSPDEKEVWSKRDFKKGLDYLGTLRAG